MHLRIGTRAAAAAIALAALTPHTAQAAGTGWRRDADNDVTVYKASPANGHIDIRRASASLTVTQEGYYNPVFVIDIDKAHAASTAGRQRFTAYWTNNYGTQTEQNYRVTLTDGGAWHTAMRSSTTGEWFRLDDICTRPTGNRIDRANGVAYLKASGRCTGNFTTITALKVTTEWLPDDTTVHARDTRGFGTATVS